MFNTNQVTRVELFKMPLLKPLYERSRTANRLLVLIVNLKKCSVRFRSNVCFNDIPTWLNNDLMQSNQICVLTVRIRIFKLTLVSSQFSFSSPTSNAFLSARRNDATPDPTTRRRTTRKTSLKTKTWRRRKRKQKRKRRKLPSNENPRGWSRTETPPEVTSHPLPLKPEVEWLWRKSSWQNSSLRFSPFLRRSTFSRSPSTRSGPASRPRPSSAMPRSWPASSKCPTTTRSCSPRTSSIWSKLLSFYWAFFLLIW